MPIRFHQDEILVSKVALSMFIDKLLSFLGASGGIQFPNEKQMFHLEKNQASVGSPCLSSLKPVLRSKSRHTGT